MTINTDLSKRTYTGNGVKLDYDYDFKIPLASDLKVSLYDLDGVEHVQVLDTDYEITGAGSDAGGQVIFMAAPADDWTIILLSNADYTQPTDFKNQGRFFPETHENSFDRAVILARQLNERVSRSVLVPVSAVGVTGELDAILPLQSVRLNAAGTAMEAFDVTPYGGVGGSNLIGYQADGTGAQLRTIQDKLRDTVSVKDFGAFADGVLYDDLPFQRAIAFASTNCRAVIMPAGTYRFAATVQVPAGVELIGEGAKPYTGPNNVAVTAGTGTWLHFDHSGIGLQFVGGTAASSASSLKNCGTMRTHAAPGGGWTATVYDYDIDVQGVETFIEDVCLLNPYKGIRIINSGYGRLWLNRVRGQAFNEFINLEQSYDTTRVTNCHQWPYWSQQADVTTYQQANLKTYRVARSDTTILSGCFSIYQNVGLEVYGTVNGTAYRLRVTDCEFDHTTYGVRVLSSADDASILFSGLGLFGATGSTTSRGVWIESTNSRFSFVNSDISLFGLDGFRVDGTNNILQMANTRVRYYNQAAVGASAYEVAATNLMEFADRPYAIQGGAGPLFGAVANVYKAPLGGGLVGGVTDGSGDYTVTHGLGTSPTVQVTGIANGSNRVALKSQGATTFVVTLYDVAGTPQASTALNFNWQAWKE